MKDQNAALALIDHIHQAFENYLSKDWGFDSLRINFAGGEPLIYREQLLKIAEYCQSKGIRTSLITNASYLLAHQPDLSNFNIIGISIDALDHESNVAIGRHDRQGNTLSIPALQNYLTDLKQNQPDLGIKINTVVNAVNWQQDMNDFIQTIAPYKWKVFKMLPVITDQLSVSDDEFQQFLARHEALSTKIVSEDNSEMTESYLMIDPNGRFYSNASTMISGEYRYSSAINDLGVMTALAEIDFDLGKFRARY